MTQTTRKSPPENLLLAVDTGGSKTAAWLVDTTQNNADRVVGRGRASGGNPLSTSFEESTRAIAAAATQAFDDAQLPACTVSRAILSIAGAANHQLSTQFGGWAKQDCLAERVAVVSDVLPVLAAGTPNCCGIALVSGTGSVAFARAADGRTMLCGGWGFLLGDEGSGYAIGRAAVRNCMHALESLAAQQPLAEATRKAIGVKSVVELTRVIYEDSNPRGAIAAVAPIVFAAAEEGDSDAQAILDAAARELAKLVSRTARLIGPNDQSISLAVAGGVLVNCKRVRDTLDAELRRIGLASEMRVVDDPLEGCIRLAEPEFDGNLVAWQ